MALQEPSTLYYHRNPPELVNQQQPPTHLGLPAASRARSSTWSRWGMGRPPPAVRHPRPYLMLRPAMKHHRLRPPPAHAPRLKKHGIATKFRINLRHGVRVLRYQKKTSTTDETSCVHLAGLNARMGRRSWGSGDGIQGLGRISLVWNVRLWCSI